MGVDLLEHHVSVLKERLQVVHIFLMVADAITNDLARVDESHGVEGLVVEAHIETVPHNVIELICIYVISLIADYVKEPSLFFRRILNFWIIALDE